VTPAEQIGKKIKAARERKGLTQKECATKLPVSQSTWCDWENGRQAPRYSRLPALAKLLGTAVARLLA
jgi:transcriptional regulator with XRE-family HTH domain